MLVILFFKSFSKTAKLLQNNFRKCSVFAFRYLTYILPIIYLHWALSACPSWCHSPDMHFPFNPLITPIKKHLLLSSFFKGKKMETQRPRTTKLTSGKLGSQTKGCLTPKEGTWFLGHKIFLGFSSCSLNFLFLLYLFVFQNWMNPKYLGIVFFISSTPWWAVCPGGTLQPVLEGPGRDIPSVFRSVKLDTETSGKMQGEASRGSPREVQSTADSWEDLAQRPIEEACFAPPTGGRKNFSWPSNKLSQ